MIRASFFRNSENLFCGFELSGHAGFAEEGKDIVCAAVSALAQNTVNSIEAFADEIPEVRIGEEGYLFCCVASLKEGKSNDKAELLLRSFKLGLDEISKEYGKSYLKVTSNKRA